MTGGRNVGLKRSWQQLSKIAEETGSEITFMADGSIQWYWRCLRFDPEVEDVPRLIQALKELSDIGCEQQ